MYEMVNNMINMSFGGMATHILEPVFIVSSSMYLIYLMLGIGSLTAAIFKLIEHRVNPMLPPSSNIIFLFIAGSCLLAVAFLIR